MEKTLMPTLQLAEESCIAFDPGETTGIAFFTEGQLASVMIVSYQDMIKNMAQRSIFDRPVVCEEFVLYAHKSQSMINNKMVSARVIGMLEVAAYQSAQPIHFQSASNAKTLVTDDKLKKLGMYDLPNVPSDVVKHVRDAIRHGVLYLAKRYQDENQSLL